MWETAEPQTLDEIRDWYRNLLDALVQQRASIKDAIRKDLAVSFRYLGMTETEVDELYDADQRELDRLTMLNLVASVEGTIKQDYHQRIHKRLRDPLSKAYQKWHATLSHKKRLRPDFDEQGILEFLKKSEWVDRHVIGQFRVCLPTRHWVGHGRYWNRPLEINKLDPDEVYDRAQALLTALPI